MPTYYTYAIIHTPTEDAPLPGIGLGLNGRPIELIPVEETGLSLSVSEWPYAYAPPAATNISCILEHENIIERLMLITPVLPVRYGTLIADNEQFKSYLYQHRDAFLANLVHVTGRIEMGVRVFWIPPNLDVETETVATPGRQYLMARAQALSQNEKLYNAAQILADQICERLRKVAFDIRCQRLLTKRMLLSAACLVQKEDIELFRQETLSLCNVYTDLRFTISGPWPAYHFVTTEEKPIHHDNLFRVYR